MVNEVPPENNKLLQEDNDNLMANFEKAIAELEQQHYCLRLYIAGTTPVQRGHYNGSNLSVKLIYKDDMT